MELTELFWARAERWVTDCAHGQHGRGRRLCPMCGVLPVSGAFLIGGRGLVLCLECACEVRYGRRRAGE